MQPFNPFLRSFFASKLPAQCSPPSHFVLLVPTSEFLITQIDKESQSPFVDLVQNEDFLASHVLRIPGVLQAGAGFQNLRESKAKTKQYTTLNGRTVVFKDNFVYSNKGFKNLVPAQLLHDELYHADTPDLAQWLIYYIARPLLGIPTAPTVQPLKALGKDGDAANKRPGRPPLSKKKHAPASFADLLGYFPMVARHVQPGFERAYEVFEKSSDASTALLTPSSSATTIYGDPPSPTTDETTPIIASTELGRTLSKGYTALDESQRSTRDALETLVVSALDVFQSLDKQHLGQVALETTLTGTAIERMIERHVVEHVHYELVWPRICDWQSEDDEDLDLHIKQMGDVDIAQIGLVDDDADQGKSELTRRVNSSVIELRKMITASSPQEMLEVLLATQKMISMPSTNSEGPARTETTDDQAAATSTMNADTLVSLLLMTVIRSPVRRLHARFMYMKNFNFLTETESGHAGYALSTFEAVLSYLSNNSRGLRNISRTNRKLWQAVKKGDVPQVRAMLDPMASVDEDVDLVDLSAANLDENDQSHMNAEVFPVAPPKAHFAEDATLLTESNLTHVFPFESKEYEPPDRPKMKKRVSMDTHSMSSSSINSFASGSSTAASMRSMIDGETTAEQLCQTIDNNGRSIMFMAIEAQQPRMLRYLLQLEHLIMPKLVLDDRTAEGTSLLSSAVQQGSEKLIDMILDYLLEHSRNESQLLLYMASQDNSGRSAAHWCFSAPYLIAHIGHLLPWRQRDKNGQTPLFAMCRSYDSEGYHQLAMAAITAAARQQGRQETLHLADHVDNKGNTLLHIVNNTSIIEHLLFHCTSDPNATNDRRFTPLMVASKFARLDSMRAFFTDARIDLQARDLRGLTAVEVAKDDDVRNRIDDMVLLLSRAAADGRKTSIVRAVLVDDGSIRLIIKSGAPTGQGTITVTTSRRSLTDFENLVLWLSLEQPASYLPLVAPFRSPFQITPKPSKQVLRDTQLRLDGFLQTMLSHPTFATHEMLWEFFLVPDIDPRMLAERAKQKAELRVENLSQDHPVPLTSPTEMSEVEIFAGHAIGQLRQVQSALKTSIRRLVTVQNVNTDLAEAHRLALKQFASVAPYTPSTHLKALQDFAATLTQSEYPPTKRLIYNMHTSLAATGALLSTLSTRPQTLISAINGHRQTLARNMSSSPGVSDAQRRSRSPLPLIASLPQRLNLRDSTTSKSDAAERADRSLREMETLGRELRYTQATVAGELAGWQNVHASELKDAIKGFARRMVVTERHRLQCMYQARREILKQQVGE